MGSMDGPHPKPKKKREATMHLLKIDKIARIKLVQLLTQAMPSSRDVVLLGVPLVNVNCPPNAG